MRAGDAPSRRAPHTLATARLIGYEALITLRLHFLGPPEAINSSGALLPIRRKNWALLAYLALTATPHRRMALAALFCAAAANPAAALRVMLSRIRRLHPHLLIAEGDSVSFNAQAAWVDCAVFSQTLAGDLAQTGLAQLEEAVDLYRGELLQGLSLPDSAEFDLWLLGQRAYIQQLYTRGLTELVARYIAQGAHHPAIRRAQQLLQANPLLESAHAQLIWLYAHTGQRDAALRQFELCRDMLWRELRVEPAPELQALHQELLNSHLPAPFPAPLTSPTPATLPAPGFVGRRSQLHRLQAAWQACTGGQGSVLLIAAEAGVGKSRLVHEFANGLPPAAVRLGRCYESTATLPYHPWTDLLETHLAALLPSARRLSPFAREHLARLLPSLAREMSPGAAVAAPQSGRDLEPLFVAIRELLLAPSSPLFIFIDNLQWAGETSLNLFHFLARHAAASRFLLVGAFRADESGDHPPLQTLLADLQRLPAGSIALPPLSTSDVAALVMQLWPTLPAAARPTVVDRLVQATGGNALFITELLRELAESDHLPQELPVPATVRHLMHRRLARLPQRQQQVLETLAILHSAATLLELQQMSARSEDEVAHTIDWGLRRGLLQAQTAARPVRYDFHHDLVRQAVAEQVSQPRRDLLHTRLARTLENAGAPAALLAYHWALAGNTKCEAHYAAAAARQSAAVYANDEAIRYFRRALQLLPSPTTAGHAVSHSELLCDFAECLLLVGDWPEAGATIRYALQIVGAHGLRLLHARAMSIQARLLEVEGHFGEALNSLRGARDDAEAVGDDRLAARYLGEMARVYWRQGNYEQAHAYAAAALSQSRRLADHSAIAAALNTLGLIHWRRAAHIQALDCFHEACRLYNQVGPRVSAGACLGNIGNIYKDLEDYRQALTYYQAALQSDQELGNRMGVARHLGNIGVVHYNLADYDEAKRYYRQALEIDRQLGHREGVARHLGNIGNLFWQKAQYDRTLDYYLQALQIDHESGNRPGVALHTGNLGVVYSRCGAAGPAAACLNFALQADLRLGDRLGVARHLGNLADLQRRQGHLELALSTCDRAIALLQQLNNQFHLSWAWVAKAKILAARKEYEPALTFAQQGEQAALAVKRQDTLFAAQHLVPSLAHAAGRLDVATAVARLTALLPAWPADDQQAAITYACWQLDKENVRARRRATALYKDLAANSPDVTFRTRLAELTGGALPPPPPLPPLPAFVAAHASHPRLMHKIDGLLAGPP